MGIQAALLMLGAALFPVGAQAQAVDPHLVRPNAVMPHPVVAPASDPAPDDGATEDTGAPAQSLRLGSTPAGNPPGPGWATPTAPPAYLQCPSTDQCGPLTPEEKQKLKEELDAQQAEKREEEEERREKAAKLRAKYLAEHPPTVIELYIGQFLCPLWERSYAIASFHYDETHAAGLGPSDGLLSDIEALAGLLSSRSCITTVRP